MTGRPGRGQEVVERLVALGLTSVLALATTELAMRLYCFVPRAFDPEFGYVAVGRAHWFREGAGVSHWGSRGVRQSSTVQGETRRRILVVGDSFTEAVHVDDDEVYTDIVERQLRGLGRDVRVLNVGTAGSSLPYYVHLGPSYRRVFDPDWVVVQLSEGDVLEAAFDPSDSHFVVRSDGSLELRPLPLVGRGGYLRRTVRWLRAESALLQNAVLQYRGFERVARDFQPFVQGEAVPPPRLGPSRQFPIRAELELLRDAFGGHLTILFLSTWDSRTPARPTDAEQQVRAACSSLGMSCAFTRDEFSGLAARRAFPNGFPNSRAGFGHLNGAGHAAAAAVLGRELLEGPARAVF